MLVYILGEKKRKVSDGLLAGREETSHPSRAQSREHWGHIHDAIKYGVF